MVRVQHWETAAALRLQAAIRGIIIAVRMVQGIITAPRHLLARASPVKAYLWTHQNAAAGLGTYVARHLSVMLFYSQKLQTISRRSGASCSRRDVSETGSRNERSRLHVQDRDADRKKANALPLKAIWISGCRSSATRTSACLIITVKGRHAMLPRAKHSSQ